MKRYQRGEVMLAAMAVMLVVAWLGRGHMGMMGAGHVSGRAAAAVEAEQAAKGHGPATPAAAGRAEHRN